MDDIVREIAFMLNLMKEFGMKLKKPLVILEDIPRYSVFSY